jgi:chitin synthase
MPGQYNSPPEEEGANDICSGRILQRLPRRYKTLKYVEYVYSSTCLRIRPADPFRPHALIQTLPQRLCARLSSPAKDYSTSGPTKMKPNSTHTPYSAATSGLNDFKDNGFALRQVHYGPPRRTDLFIVDSSRPCTMRMAAHLRGRCMGS